MDDDFDYNDTAPCPTRPQEFLLENLCGKKGQSAGGYSPPAPHSAAMRWKEMNEQNMMLQLEEKHLVKKQNVQTSKEAAREIIRKIPVELLAKEWLSKEDATVDMRAYLVDHVLPTLILGVERLLREVDEKGLSATNRFEPEFNPINFLAQYLMRNNPRFSNFAEASPYVRGLREVSEEIKQELFTFEDNRLARIKAESRRKRLEREKVEQALQEAKQQRHEQLTFLYQHFNMPSDKYKVELALVQNALRSFGEIVEQWPKEQQEAAKLGKPFDQTDETGKALSVDDFVQYLSPFVEHLPMETFDIFIKHMAKCAALYRATAEKESKRIILTNLFLMLDHGGRFNNIIRIIQTKEPLLGLLGRQRLLELLERFWDVYVVNGEFPGTLRNPRRWPVIEVEETDDSMFDAWEEEPDGGLTMSDMYTADTEISKIYQEVHRMATIAAVHDKTAVEKWKIKQLSEKSEGMRWKMYKYNVTDFLNLTDFSYMDTLEAPKQYMNLEEKAAEGKLRYHDLYPMTMTKTKEERDTLVDRKKPIAPEDEMGQAEDGENNPLANEGSMVTDGAQPGVEEEGTSRVDANANAKAGDEILNEVTTPERVDRNNQNETAVEEDTGLIQEMSKDGCIVNEDSSAILNNDVVTETFHLHPENQLNILFPADKVGAETFEETTVKTPSPKICDSTGPGSGNLNNNMTFPNDVTTESSDSETSNDTDTTVTELGLYSDSSRTSISESSEFSDGFLTPNTGGGFRPRFYALPSGTEDYKTPEEEETNVDEELEEKVSRLREILNSSKVGLLKGQPPTRHDVSRLQNVKNLPHLPHLSDTLHRGIYTDRATSPYDPLPPIPTKKRVRFDPSNTNFNKGDHSLETQPDELTEKNETLAGKAQNTEDPEKKDLSELMKKLSLPVGEFLNFMYKDENINFNKQLIDANINSCYRVRNITTPVVQRTQSQLSAFDINTLNMSQFVVLLETFLGNEPNYDYFERLIKFLKDNYSDTEDEKMERMMKGRREVISAKRKLMIDTLFEKWDNDGSGFLEMEDVQEVLFKYKDGQEVDGIKKAQTALRKASKFNDQRLSKQEFRQLIELVVKEMPGSENFEQLLDFLMNSVERSYAERIRGEARKKWLKQIITAAHFSGTLMDPVYKAVFQALYKDAETHGGEKRISANIALLEVNKMEPRRGPLLLRYSACTPEDCQYMLGKALFKNMKGVSFQAIETGKPVHVPRVANHGSIYFWNYDRTRDDRDGSLVVVPLKDVKKRVFGTLGIDTLCDPYKKSIFITHEVQFFQGVAKAFSIAYHQVEMRRKLLRVAESALLWMSKRCPHITDIAVYLVEPNQMPDGDPVLRKMMVSDKKSPCIYLTEVVRLERKNNLFRDYLFQCMENSDTVMAEAYGERHTATPLRNLSGKALGVVDISIGEIKKLPQFENKEAQRMLRLLQKASKDIAGESQGIERKRLLEAEKDDSSNVTMLFESYMLAELRENISKLDQMAFAELKSYYQPPKVILEICRAALSIFDAEKAGEGQYEDWPVVKNSINNAFINQIKSYDPTKSTEYVKAERVSRYLKATFSIPHGEVGKYGSIPALLLYNWVFCVLSLIESTIKMREAEEQLQTLIKASNPVTSD